ncbi:MAG: ABC transporter ATP-binding protein [Firmicutes bacterium]|jgi:putative ABC transport system ATP-binding protein|nr:ABC transporter ATP-binding protein [Bacillota bacterium]HHX26314.1 ABC transporter ATP-binding protein [Bacillota bacterium]
MIRLEGVTKVYETEEVRTTALGGVDLVVEKGEFLAIMGPSGSGKTTLLNIIGCLDIPTKGEYLLDNVKVQSLSRTEQARLRNRRFGFIFQTFNLIPELSAMENVELPLMYRGEHPSVRTKLAQEALQAMGLEGRMNHRPPQLSGGQKQRVAIARSLVGDPECILADEPTGSLDSIAGGEILRMLKALSRDFRKSIVMVTHDHRAASMADRIIYLQDGLINNETDMRQDSD